jgi:hypothetical protein
MTIEINEHRRLTLLDLIARSEDSDSPTLQRLREILEQAKDS